MSDISIETGDADLDRDLRLLFEFAGSDRLTEIRTALAGQGLRPEEFAELVPIRLVIIGNAVLQPATFSSLCERFPKAGDILARAKDLVTAKMLDILHHPHATEAFARACSERDEQAGPLAGALKTITGMAYVQTWIGPPPEMIPAVRVLLTDKKREVLLDTLLHWAELIQVVEGLLGIAVHCMTSGRALAEREQLDRKGFATMGAAIRRIEEHLAQIRTLAPIYRVEIPQKADSTLAASTPKIEN